MFFNPINPCLSVSHYSSRSLGLSGRKVLRGYLTPAPLRVARVAEIAQKDGRITYVLKNKTDIRLCVSPRLCERLMGLIAFEV
jgi:hypothetical protein